MLSTGVVDSLLPTEQGWQPRWAASDRCHLSAQFQNRISVINDYSGVVHASVLLGLITSWTRTWKLRREPRRCHHQRTMLLPHAVF